MFRDAHGLEVTAPSARAAQAFDRTVIGYLGYSADAPQRLVALLDADPEFGLAHCLKGCFAMLSYRQAALPAAAADARHLIERATPREQAHIAALRLWIDGEPDRAAAVWEQILGEHPRDVPAFRQLQHVLLGVTHAEPVLFLDAAMQVEQHDDARLPLERAAGRWPIPLQRRVGYAAAAQVLAI